jgi:Na+-driven multidrug efflux pump
MGFVFGASFLIRGEGKVTAAMVLVGAGSLFNVALDALFVAVWGMGAAGAAWATLATQIVCAIATALYLWSPASQLEARRWRPTLALDLAPALWRDGATAMLFYAMAVAQQAIVFVVAARWGSADDVVFVGAYLRLMMLALVPMWGMAMAIGPVVGVCHGAGDRQRVRRALQVFLLGATAAGVALWLCVTMWPSDTLALLIDDPLLCDARAPVLRWLMLPLPFVGGQLIVAATLVAMGSGGRAAAILVARSVLLLLPLALIMPSIWGIDGLWGALVVTDLSCVPLSLYALWACFKEDRRRTP